MNEEPFYSYGSYLKNRYGKSAFRVGIDAGFSCPNRAGGRSSSGCSYCDAFGARAMYQRTEGALSDQVDENLKKDIAEQSDKAVEFLKKRYKAEILLLYFQAFSGTYAPVEHLRAVYDYALSLQPFKELIVSTRPDCIDQEKAELLASYRQKGLDVWVELGLQSSNDDTLRRVKRGHSVDDFRKAFFLLREYGIKTAVHLIFGLPGEGAEEINETARYTAELNPEGVKFHNLHIPYNSDIYNEYLRGEADAPTTEEYLEYVISAIELMPESTVIMRLTCDSREDERAAPKEFIKKNGILQSSQKRNEKKGNLSGATL